MNPMPVASKIEGIYHEYHQTSNYLRKLKKKLFTSKYKLKKLRKYTNPQQNNFLDVGCSIGATVEAAHRLGYNATGIDLDDSVIKQAKQLFPGCHFDTLTLDDLQAKNLKFNLIYCAEVIEHVPDPHEFLESISAVLSKGAVLYITTPDAGHRKVPKDFLSWRQVTPPEHIVFFSKKTMSRLLTKHGFEVIKFKWSHRANLRVICRKK